jgi:predicted SAM-dependent methyltransferase
MISLRRVSLRHVLSGRSSRLLRAHAIATRRLHLGCGLVGLGHGAKILPGWTNIDLHGDGRSTFGWDLTRPLPLPDASIDYIYSEHFIEHLSLDHGLALARECRRVLTDDGVLRLSTPDLQTLIRAYRDGTLHEWADMGWRPASACDLLNEGLREWGHQYVYDHDKLGAMLRDSGFATVIPCAWGGSAHDLLCRLETRPYHADCIVEAFGRATSCDRAAA